MRWIWVAVGGCALAVPPAGLLPGFVVEVTIGIGAGDEQRVLPAVFFEHRLLEYGHPLYVGALGCAGVVVVAAIWGLLRPDPWYPIVPALVAALTGAALLNAGQLEASDSLGGGFQREALDQARRAVATSHPGDNVHPLFDVYATSGWKLTVLAFAVIAAVTGFALARRVRIPWWLPFAVAGFALVVLWELPEQRCSDDVDTADPSSHPIGRLAVYACLALVSIGLGMATDETASRRRRFAGGVPCMVGGTLAGLVTLFTLIGMEGALC